MFTWSIQVKKDSNFAKISQKPKNEMSVSLKEQNNKKCIIFYLVGGSYIIFSFPDYDFMKKNSKKK